jgi:hypothetical protein
MARVAVSNRSASKAQLLEDDGRSRSGCRETGSRSWKQLHERVDHEGCDEMSGGIIGCRLIQPFRTEGLGVTWRAQIAAETPAHSSGRTNRPA